MWDVVRVIEKDKTSVVFGWIGENGENSPSSGGGEVSERS
jgi:hypothetical protein